MFGVDQDSSYLKAHLNMALWTRERWVWRGKGWDLEPEVPIRVGLVCWDNLAIDAEAVESDGQD